jgi:DNA-binding Lrp family transcriptional regulator
MDLTSTTATRYDAPLDAADRALLRAIEPGLPLVARPYAALAAKVGLPEAEVIRRLGHLTAIGAIRRLGVVVRHRALGYRANALVVWALPEWRVAQLGVAIGRLPFVTLSYRRPARPPDWPYNLFTMIHGRDREAVLDQVQEVRSTFELDDVPHAVLFSGRCFKQRGAKYGMPRSDASAQTAGESVNAPSRA